MSSYNGQLEEGNADSQAFSGHGRGSGARRNSNNTDKFNRMASQVQNKLRSMEDYSGLYSEDEVSLDMKQRK